MDGSSESLLFFGQHQLHYSKSVFGDTGPQIVGYGPKAEAVFNRGVLTQAAYINRILSLNIGQTDIAALNIPVKDHDARFRLHTLAHHVNINFVFAFDVYKLAAPINAGTTAQLA